jgi:hypothetical protein
MYVSEKFKEEKQNTKIKNFAEGRFKCSMQRQINNNKISKDKL